MKQQRSHEEFEKLLQIMTDLRRKCPWDREQTLESLRYLTIEETYELSDAILEKKMDDVCKELGDLMLHIVFYAKIAEEDGFFDMADVLSSINEKLTRRHPHIYGNTDAKDAEAVKNNWEKIKLKEGNRSVLAGVPMSLPAMVKAHRIQEKARGIGFDWDHRDQVKEKVMEEFLELDAELSKSDNHQKTEEEMGDLLFALINYARFIGVNPEDALERTNRKFIKRFEYMEKRSAETGRQMYDMTLKEMDEWWEEAKRQ